MVKLHPLIVVPGNFACTKVWQFIIFSSILVFVITNIYISDFTELSLPRNCEISFPNGEEDFMVFDVAIKPNAGFYRLFSNIA